MSRSGYHEDCDDNWGLIKWRGQVASAIRGKRGQAFLRELVDALDAMPEKKLIAGALECPDGVCAIGAVGARRGLPMANLDIEDADLLGDKFGIASQMVKEIEYENDEVGPDNETPEARWHRVRKWAESKLAGNKT